MINPVLQKSLKVAPLLLLCLLAVSFKTAPNTAQLLEWSNRLLLRTYDPSGDAKLKKWELSVSADYFLRLRKTYQNGKQEYYSVQLGRFSDMDYLGTTANGLIRINTKADDVIVQTYNDRKGDVDSMATAFTIPVKNMEAEQADSLRNALQYFKSAVPIVSH